MKQEIDSFTSATGWSGSSVKASVYGLNSIPEFIAGLNSQSLIFKFQNNPQNEYIQKTVSINLTGYEEIVFWVWSRNKKGTGVDFEKSSDYAYKIDFGTGKEYYIPFFDTFSDVTIDVRGITSITKIKITCLHNTDDYIIMSNMFAVKDELPVDIWKAVKEQLEYDIASLYPRLENGISSKGIELGTISCASGNDFIEFTDSIEIAEKYSVVLIDDGVNSEIHQLNNNDGLSFNMFSTYDGMTIKHNHTSKKIYLLIPVEYGMSETEINLPGISIQGMAPEEQIDINKLDHARDTFETGEVVSERVSDANFKYSILIDCEARTNEMIAFMSLVVRYFMARQVLWVNAKRIHIIPEVGSVYQEPIEAFNQIPKIQFIMSITIKEEVYNREKLYKTIQNNRIFSIGRP